MTKGTDTERILRERAQTLARVPPPPAADTLLELLEFGLASERYAIERRYVQEVQPLRELTPLPCTPPFILGIVNVRGRIVPVLDLKKFFELPERGLTDLHRTIIVRGHDLEIGLLADVIIGISGIPAESLQPSLPTLTGIRADYLKGVTDARLVVLAVDRILSDPRIIVHEEVED
ncbi:MAG: chemotaxis protein CheW [Steroidobacteraceae bacterium]